MVLHIYTYFFVILYSLMIFRACIGPRVIGRISLLSVCCSGVPKFVIVTSPGILLFQRGFYILYDNIDDSCILIANLKT